jgi:hypothetical protein
LVPRPLRRRARSRDRDHRDHRLEGRAGPPDARAPPAGGRGARPESLLSDPRLLGRDRGRRPPLGADGRRRGHTASSSRASTRPCGSRGPKPKGLLLNFPHNPTTRVVDSDFFERVVDFAREHRLWVIHDFTYADLVFDGYRPPSFLATPGREGRGASSSSRSPSRTTWPAGGSASRAATRAWCTRWRGSSPISTTASSSRSRSPRSWRSRGRRRA